MSSPRGIIVFGANGSGKTTLGRELASILNFKHMDHEVYAFKESKIPYAKPRSYAECVELMLSDIKKCHGFVISAVTGDFGNEIVPLYKLGAYISAPLELRLQRFERREYKRHGERVLKGGDMYESRMEFRNFIASRSLARIEQWAEALACPVIRVDGTIDWRFNALKIAELYWKIAGDKNNG